MPGDSTIVFEMPYKDYYQFQEASAGITGSLSDSEKLQPSDIKYGRLPENKREIAVDKKVLKTAIEDYGTKMAGLASPRDFLGKTVTVPNMKDRKIVGITDKSSPCIYAEQDTFINLLSNAPKEG